MPINLHEKRGGCYAVFRTPAVHNIIKNVIRAYAKTLVTPLKTKSAIEAHVMLSLGHRAGEHLDENTIAIVQGGVMEALIAILMEQARQGKL